MGNIFTFFSVIVSSFIVSSIKRSRSSFNFKCNFVRIFLYIYLYCRNIGKRTRKLLESIRNYLEYQKQNTINQAIQICRSIMNWYFKFVLSIWLFLILGCLVDTKIRWWSIFITSFRIYFISNLFDSYFDSIMQNSVVILTFSVFDRKYPF